ETLSTARPHHFVHHDRKGLYHKLHDTEVVKNREQRRNKDDGGQDLKREDDAETRLLLPDLPEHKAGSDVRVAQDRLHDFAQRTEQVPPERDPQHEDRERELQPQSPTHHPPTDGATIPGQGDTDAEDEGHAE